MLDLNLLLEIIFGLLFFLIFLFIFSYFLVLYIRNKNRLVSARFQTILLIRLPKDNEIKLGVAEQLFSSFFAIKKSGIPRHFRVRIIFLLMKKIKIGEAQKVRNFHQNYFLN